MQAWLHHLEQLRAALRAVESLIPLFQQELL